MPMCHGSRTADMNMKYLIIGYIQKEMIVSMCHGRRTGTADINRKYLIIGSMQKEMIVQCVMEVELGLQI